MLEKKKKKTHSTREGCRLSGVITSSSGTTWKKATHNEDECFFCVLPRPYGGVKALLYCCVVGILKCKLWKRGGQGGGGGGRGDKWHSRKDEKKRRGRRKQKNGWRRRRRSTCQEDGRKRRTIPTRRRRWGWGEVKDKEEQQEKGEQQWEGWEEEKEEWGELIH